MPSQPTRLTGDNARLEFDGQCCVINYLVPMPRSLLRALDGRPIPVQALADAVLSQPHNDSARGTLRLVPAPGTDAVADILGMQLPEAADPYLIRFHRKELHQARRLHELLAQGIHDGGQNTRPQPIMPVPAPPAVLRATRGQAEFDGHVIRLSGGTHHSADGSALVIPLIAVESIGYVHGRTPSLSFRLPGAAGQHVEPHENQDRLTLNSLHEGANVLFAARLLEAHRAGEAAISPVVVRTEHLTDGDTAFAVSAELKGRSAAGSIRVSGPSAAIREIVYLTVDPSVSTSDVPIVEDALIKATLRWCYASGVERLVSPASPDSGSQAVYRRHGFAEDTNAPVDTLALTLDRYGSADVLGVLEDVSPRRRRAAGCGSWIVGLLLFFGLLFIGGAYRLAAGPRIAGVPLGFLAIALVIALTVWPRVRATLRARELKHATDARAILRADPRPPVVYLRSFRDDERARRPARFGSLVTEEEAVSTAMVGIGPFIGLDRNIETLGAAKGRVSDKDWRPAVTTLISRCRLTVMRCGAGESLFWELQQARKLLRPEQFLILVPHDQELYETFRQRAAKILPHPLPPLRIPRHPHQRLVAAIRFSEDWQPTTISLRMTPLLRFFSLESCLVFRLLPGLPGFHPERRFFFYRRLMYLLVIAFAVFVLMSAGLSIVAALTDLSPAPGTHSPTFPTHPVPSTGDTSFPQLPMPTVLPSGTG